ncbi:MAG: hypothetical protein ACYC1M_10440 [Armatimonadota bacterium]
MTLREFIAEKRNTIFEQLKLHQKPEGRILSEHFDEAIQLPIIQLGAIRYTPHGVILEYSFRSEGDTQVIIIPISVHTPEPVVFLPVPHWVHAQIWQGEVKGSFHLASEARALVDELINDVFNTHQTAAFETQGDNPYQRES